MSLHTRKQFAKLCGITEQQVAVYVGRKKIIETNKKIDDTVAQNKEFIEKKSGKTLDVKVVVKPQATSPEEVEEFKKKSADYEARRKLENKKKALEIDKLESESELIKLKREKLQGLTIPTDLVKSIFSQHFKSVTIAFQQCGEEWLMEISKKKS